MKSLFVWTEIFNCGKIGNQALKSYLKFHTVPVTVFGFENDLREVEDHPLVKKVSFPKHSLTSVLKWIFPKLLHSLSATELGRAFKEGHKGTALLWTHIIKKYRSHNLVHFDSDVIFLRESLSRIIDGLDGYDLIGPVRLYKNNLNNRNDVSDLENVVQTVFFGFKPKLISQYDFYTLWNMVRGTFNPLNHPVIDFFDPVSFDMLKNGAKVKFLDADEFGGTTPRGDRTNKYSDINDFPTQYKIDFGENLIHFSAVGSGMNFFERSTISDVPETYKRYAIDRFALYSKVILNVDLGIDLTEYRFLIQELKKHLEEVKQL